MLIMFYFIRDGELLISSKSDFSVCVSATLEFEFTHY